MDPANDAPTARKAAPDPQDAAPEVAPVASGAGRAVCGEFRGPRGQGCCSGAPRADGDEDHSDECACVVCGEPKANHRRAVCAWCSVVMREGNGPTTHGICAPCAGKMRTP